MVVSSQGIGNGFTYEDAASNPARQSLYGDPIKKLHSMGVPFVCSAENAAQEDKDEMTLEKANETASIGFPRSLQTVTC